jgi:hypothetical protein
VEGSSPRRKTKRTEAVEAAGIEPVPVPNPNRLMAHDLPRYSCGFFELPLLIESPGVHCCPLESTPVVEK